MQYQGDHRPHCSHEQHLNEVIYKISGQCNTIMTKNILNKKRFSNFPPDILMIHFEPLL